jgi:O-antigen ligase
MSLDANSPTPPSGPRWLGWLDRAAPWAVVLVPVFLVHGRLIADALMALVGLAWAVRVMVLRDFAALRRPWLVIGLLWWAWVVACSVPLPGRGGVMPLLEAVVMLRYLLFLAAAESWALAPLAARRGLRATLSLALLYIGLQAATQFFTGKNWFGHGRWPDGELTGPYDKPRAGGQVEMLFYPVLLPPVARLLGRDNPWPLRLAGAALGLLGLALIVLIGQRMPFTLTFFGLFVTAIFLRPLRPYLAAGALAAVVLVGASSVISPPTFYRLVTKYSHQLSDFRESPYGVIFARARAMVMAHPVMGLGHDGFRNYCGDPAYFHGWRWPKDPTDDGGGPAGCQQHPHNIYLEAAVNGGLVGLGLFAAMAVAWLVTLGRGLWREPDPLRVGLFVMAVLFLWPVASTSSFSAMPLSGFFFVQLGLGLAEARLWREGRRSTMG